LARAKIKKKKVVPDTNKYYLNLRKQEREKKKTYGFPGN